MLEAKAKIEINKPINQVWDWLTEPNVSKFWISNGEGGISSEWQLGSKVGWQLKNGGDFARGKVLERTDQKTLSFSLHDSFEEDHHDPNLDEDWKEDIWTFSLEENIGKTILSLAIGDFDSEHDTDSLHEHQEVENTWKDTQDNGIPTLLKNINQEINN